MTDLSPSGSMSPVLEVRDLTVEFNIGRHNQPPLRAVNGVSLAINARETVGLVGESGSGKTTLSRAILGLVPITSGTVSFAGVDITNARVRDRRSLSAHLQIVFQDPYSSLNPTRTIGQTLGETLRVHGRLPRTEVERRVQLILARVGLPAEAVKRYPSHFSGGQRQRIAIARALIVQPRLVICDEPVSALDLSVQAQVLNLLRELQREFELAYLFISHDLAVVRHVSHRIIVLYRGRVMEEGDAATIYSYATHPYTRALLAAAPVPSPDLRRRLRPAVAVESKPTAELGCPFAPRCPHAIDICRSELPELEATPAGLLVACHRWRELYDESKKRRSPDLPTAHAHSSGAVGDNIRGGIA